TCIAKSRSHDRVLNTFPTRRSSDLDFVPKSMLHVEEHTVERAKFPVVDVHTHWSFAGKSDDGSGLRFSATPEELLAVMDRRNIRSEEHTYELQSRENLVCSLLLEKK